LSKNRNNILYHEEKENRNIMIKDKYLKNLIMISLILIIVFLITQLKDFFYPIVELFNLIIIPIIVSFFLYYMLRPIVRKLERERIHRGLMILSVLLGFILLIGIFLAYGSTVLKTQFESAFASLSKDIDIKGFVDGVLRFIPDDIIPKNINMTNEILNRLRELVLAIGNNLLNIVSKIGSFGTQIVLIPFILFYLLKDDRKFYEGFISLVPKKYRPKIDEAMKSIDQVLSTYISSQLLVSFILGVLMYIGYLIIGLPNALIMAFFAMITNIIPFIGPFLGALPAVLIAITIDWKMILKVAVLATVVQQAEGDLITPKIVGDKLKLHPLAVIFIVLISVHLFGIFGAFIGVPLYFILSILIKTIYSIKNDNRKKNFNDEQH
jgi:predicted PurR-regulated permease PerM